MKCAIHPNTDAVAQCAICSKPICQKCTIDHGGKVICFDCAAADFGNEQNQKVEDAEQQREAKKRLPLRYQIGIVVVCVIGIIVQMSFLVPMVDEAPVIDTSDSETLAEQCLGTLSEAHVFVHQGQRLNQSDVDDVCLPPLVLSETSKEIIVESPDPDLYGFKLLRVNRDNFELTRVEE